MALDSRALYHSMLSAGAGAFREHWSEVRDFARVEFKTLARRIKEIGRAVAEERIPLSSGRRLLQAQSDVAVHVLVGLTTLTLIAVEAAINAVLGAVRDMVNAALGVALL